MDFSKKIKMLRKYNHLTQEEFASKINVSRKTVSGWENERSLPDNYTVKSICNKFDISETTLTNPNIDDLFDDPLIIKSKQSLLLKYLELLELILIILSYISLLKIMDGFLISLILLLNTIIIRYILITHISKKHLHNFRNDRKKAYIFAGLLNLITCITITLYNLMFFENYSSALSTISGAIIGSFIHAILVSVAITNLYQCYQIKKYI